MYVVYHPLFEMFTNPWPLGANQNWPHIFHVVLLLQICISMPFVVARNNLFTRFELQGVSKKTLFNEIGTPGGPKTIDRVGDQSKMLSNTLYWSDVPIYPF